MSDVNQLHNRAVWFDIPVADLDRAVAFYRAVLDIGVDVMPMGETRFAVLEHEHGNGGCLVIAPELVCERGPLIYLNAEGRLAEAVAAVEAHGGAVLEPVHAIGPHGFRALIKDSEGNRMALHAQSA